MKTKIAFLASLLCCLSLATVSAAPKTTPTPTPRPAATATPNKGATAKGEKEKEDKKKEDKKKEDKEKEEKEKKEKVTICHKGHTIQVAKSAVNSHLAHGDYLGACHVTPAKNK